MTWIGIAISMMFILFAGEVLILLIGRWKIYQRSTRAFFCLYVVYLASRVCTTYYEPVTVTNVVNCLISTCLIIPMMVIIYRVMTAGDPYHLAVLISDLKHQLRQRDNAELAILKDDYSVKEQQKLQKEVERLDKVVENLETRLERLLLKQNPNA